MKEFNKTEVTKAISIRFETSLIEEIKKILDVYSISLADFIRDSVKKEVDLRKNDFFYKLSQCDYCSEEESQEIIEELNQMSEDDLKIAREEIIEF
ncbi:hypothetical protein [Fusobacterium hwasookii]|jgi:hypothetical protein|uniref:Antitoxin n=2 Tax=Fusobacterium hwasookii TaxID=1583098 RepID=A0A0S2ZQL5_9FUSO|nr:hypothetical protein [Fusobacterium hwasookii]ALQ35373.1 hypothetical protein RN92_05535 [Fusobacterium hwasookii ChDC F206]ALQ41221.1 hypothetical protein RN87_11725 [Fusobacterium hwasookii ChDC F174]